MPPVDPAGWMWSDACDMLERAERLRREFFRLRSERGVASWEPPVDVFETQGRVAIFVALPGVEAGDIEVFIDGDVVVVSGARPLPRMEDGFLIHRLEIPHGRFERKIRLTSAARLERK